MFDAVSAWFIFGSKPLQTAPHFFYLKATALVVRIRAMDLSRSIAPHELLDNGVLAKKSVLVIISNFGTSTQQIQRIVLDPIASGCNKTSRDDKT